jgi:hypothetical protein
MDWPYKRNEKNKDTEKHINIQLSMTIQEEAVLPDTEGNQEERKLLEETEKERL